jgi:serine/threonine-protein kinase
MIQRMMAKRPADRPASAAELLTQLKRMAGSRSPRTELANRPQPELATSVPGDSSSFATFDDSGPLSEAAAASMPDVGEIDFGNLPPMETEVMPTVSVLPASHVPGGGGSRSQLDRTSNAGTNNPNQSVLLGVGLALSIVALLAVVSVTIYSVVRDDSVPPTKIKASEDERGNIIVFEGSR